MAELDQNLARLQVLERENLRLRRAVEELSILNELAAAIGASRDMQEIMHKIIRRSLRAVKAEQGVITLVGEDASDPTKTLVRTVSSSGDQEIFRPDHSLLGWMHLYKSPLLINDPKGDTRFKGTRWNDAIRSVLCVPLIAQSRLVGILTIYNKKGTDGFTNEDQRLLAILAGQSAQIVENARLYEEEKKLARMQEEFKLAYNIQVNLLPKENPDLQGYDIAGDSMPAESVGGDFYDFISLNEHRMALCVGDVSGKGLPASLLMANVQATLRGQMMIDAPVHDHIKRTNRLLCQSTSKKTFVTLFFGILDQEQHLFHYVNAGHNCPYHITGGNPPEPLKRGGLVLGFLPTFNYETITLSFAPGDLLLIYSDGITEAMNTRREEFGDERLMAFLAAHANEPAQTIINNLKTEVKQFAGAEAQHDDITLLAIRRLS